MPWRPRWIVGVKLAGMDELLDILRRAFPPQAATARIAVTAVRGRTNMAPVVDHAPDLTISATQGVELSIAPVDLNGAPYDGPVVWTTSDPVGLPVTPDTTNNGRSADVATPNASGGGTITVKSDPEGLIRNADIRITYTEPVQGRMNLSAGLPVED